MMVGRLTSIFNVNYLVLFCAVAFVLYHLGQVMIGSYHFFMAQALSQPAPVIQHQPTPTSSITPITESANSYDRIVYGASVSNDQWPTRVIMPDVDIDLQLSGSVERDKIWNISDTGANFAINSAVPNGFAGNTVLFGHDRPKLFRRIHDLKAGQEILVQAQGKQYVYAMTSHMVVDPNDIRAFYQTPEATITLITCDGWTSADRYIVFGYLVRVEPL